ncbi:MAG: SIMPL domain-containing protein [Bacteroidetes bacterium]|nr:SIMPL domain-containing protein [Bacteroidota bacterium]
MKTSFSAFIIALAIIIAAYLFAGAWKKTHNTSETINVTGMAKKDFSSDLIVWKGSFSRKAYVIKEAYTQIKKDADIIKAYLIGKGVNEKEIVFSSVTINKDFKMAYNKEGMETSSYPDGFTLMQAVTIESKEVDKIEKISREVTELIDSGVEFYSSHPEYYYTKLAELKIEMLANATKDGYTRASKIAENADSKIGNLRNASMGIFQITAQNSSENYSWGGTFNTASKRKSASVTVKLEFDVK